jgi:hypothetical protein
MLLYYLTIHIELKSNIKVIVIPQFNNAFVVVLSVSSVVWPGFPTVNCKFQYIDTIVVVTNGVIKDSNIIFPVSPPQTLTAVRCLCSN